MLFFKSGQPTEPVYKEQRRNCYNTL